MAKPVYERVPTEDEDVHNSDSNDARSNPSSPDPRFERPSPPAWKRLLLIAFTVFLFWLAFAIRPKQTEDKIIYASRYSKEHKFRPAASPVITERLKDGRTRLRGALQTGRIA
ncbi:hypothetical protein CONPUDRAFT_168392 [Coniophora puteana RWD-64-598 SS2]|uniref:Uncharacterized protein n=1 Tax=Coniophora puteana (strain RWD-64-598) TaxID=741705 RepID=A0A5M3MFB0_CONPW|nr:uncharacterized protein CONPUDRAFT_168392 [Coniophora puteana RWD-64-598 SS2]EIW77474.1 hypothetical protein CONPUDRAFT_168392 [Coniophora puteana RWD-64-598 SS2]